MWSLSCDSAAAVTSACDEYNWMPVSRFPAVPGNREFLGAMQGALSEAEHRHLWSLLSSEQRVDRYHPPRHPSYRLKIVNSPFSCSVLTIFRNAGSYVSQEIKMVNQLYRCHCRVIRAQNRIWKAPNSLNSLPRRSACWNLNQIRCTTWYRGSEHCHLLQIWWEIWKEIQQIQWNPTIKWGEESDQMGGG